MDLHAINERLDAWLMPRLPEMLSVLEHMVNMDTSSHDGEDVNKLGDWIVNRMGQIGLKTCKLPKTPVPEDEPWRANMGNVFSAYTDEPGTGVFLPGHMDTVFPKGTVSRWKFHLDGDTATGPGVADMKAGLLINQFAVTALKELGYLDFPVTLTFSCDEELGSVTSSGALVEYMKNGWACLCSEPTRDIHQVIERSKGSGHLRLHVDGKGAHSSMDYASGASAIIELSKKTLCIDDLIDLEREIIVNTGLISGGTSAGTVAPWAESGIHMSYAKMDDGFKLLETIKGIASKTFVEGTVSKLSGGIRLPPLEKNENNTKMLELVKTAGKVVGIELQPIYAKWASEAGIGSYKLKLPTVCGMGPLGGGFHSEDEFLVVSSLIPRCKMLALSILLAGHEFKK